MTKDTNWNTGNWNTGNWNTCDKETGFFNTAQPTKVRVFNTLVAADLWSKAEKPDFLYFSLTEWVFEDEMTDQEKVDYDTFRTTGGYLKSYEYKEAFQKSWDEADEEDRALLFKLPEFDAEVFKEISGIDVSINKPDCQGKTVIVDGIEYELKKKV